MIAHQPGFTILSTPVALCDRRALSEAWYSALHMHKERASIGAAGVRAGGTAAATHAPGAGKHATAKPVSPGVNLAVRIGAALALPGAPANERRVLRSKLAEKIERAFMAKAPPRAASFTLEGERGRVQILLQQDRNHTQIVALCPPSAREVVAQALMHARYALALRGIAIRADVRGFTQ